VGFVHTRHTIRYLHQFSCLDEFSLGRTVNNLAFETPKQGRDFYGYLLRMCGITDRDLRAAIERADQDGQPMRGRMLCIYGTLPLGDLYGVPVGADLDPYGDMEPELVLYAGRRYYRVTTNQTRQQSVAMTEEEKKTALRMMDEITDDEVADYVAADSRRAMDRSLNKLGNAYEELSEAPERTIKGTQDTACIQDDQTQVDPTMGDTQIGADSTHIGNIDVTKSVDRGQKK